MLKTQKKLEIPRKIDVERNVQNKDGFQQAFLG